MLTYRHIDGDHKVVQPFRFVIHGGIDGYSRLLVYIGVANNNRAATVLNLFREATRQYNWPSRVHSDKGLENIDVARAMLQVQGLNRGSIITGNSVHNQRIERPCREVNRLVVSRFRNIFLFLENHGVLDVTNEVHLYCLHLVYMPLINKALQEFKDQWNSHPITTEENYSPRQLWVQGMIQHIQDDYTAVNAVASGEVVDWDEYGIEEDGPTPDIREGDLVSVPESTVVLSDDQVNTINNAINNVQQHDDQGIDSYIVALATIGTFNIT